LHSPPEMMIVTRKEALLVGRVLIRHTSRSN
jgi:hypothetical protein